MPRTQATTVIIRKRRLFPLGVAFAFYALLMVATLLVRTIFDNDTWLVVLALSGAVCLFACWLMMDWRGSPLVSFGAILLLVGTLNRILYAIEVIVYGNHFSEWPVITQDPTWALLRGEAMTVVGTLLVVYGWSRFYFRNTPADSILMTTSLHTDRKVNLGYWVMYFLPLLIMAVIGLLGFESAGALGSLVNVASISALLAILALSRPKAGRSTNRSVLLVVLLGLPYVFLALGSGMKENLIVSLLPLAVRMWQTYRSLSARVGLIVVGLLVLSLIASFVSLYRDYVWYQQSETSAIAVLQELASSPDPVELVATGGQVFLHRINALYHRGWAVDIGDNLGARPDAIFGPLLYIFIPRFVWPDKPLIQPGLEHSALVFGEDFLVWSTSSTAAGFFPALYMGGGYLAVIVASLGLGWMVARLQQVVAAARIAHAASIYGMYMCLYALRLDENFPVYMLSSPIIVVVYTLAYSIIIKAIATQRIQIPYLRFSHKKGS